MENTKQNYRRSMHNQITSSLTPPTDHTHAISQDVLIYTYFYTTLPSTDNSIEMHNYYLKAIKNKYSPEWSGFN